MKQLLLFSICSLFSFGLMAQWQAIQSPDGGAVRDLEMAGDRLFVASNAGLYYSDDMGSTWSHSFSEPYKRGSCSYIVTWGDTVLTRVKSFATNEYDYWMSENAGQHWQPFQIPPFANNVYNVHHSNEVLAVHLGVVLLFSSDLGANWQAYNANTLGFSPQQLFAGQDNRFYCLSTDGRFWRSDSVGENWEELAVTFENVSYAKLFAKDGIIIIGMEDAEIQYSQDDGQNWSVASGISEFDSAIDGFWSDGENLFTLHNRRLYQSLDNAASWSDITATQGDFLTDLLFLTDDLLFINDGKIYKSDDLTQTRTSSHAGIQVDFITDFIHTGTQLAYASGNSLHLANISSNAINGQSSHPELISVDEMVTDGENFFVNILSYGLGSEHEVYRVDPYTGESALIHASDNGSWLDSDHLEYTDGKLIYFNFSASRYSEDGGDTWIEGSELTPENCYDYIRHGDAVFYLSTTGVYRKQDGQEEWVAVNNGLDLETHPLDFLATADTRFKSAGNSLFFLRPQPENEEYMAFYVSNDNGDSWQRIAQEFSEVTLPYNNAPPGVQNIVQLGDYLFMSLRDVGVVVSADQGLNWTVYNDGLPPTTVLHLELIDDRLIVSMQYQSFWELGLENLQLASTEGQVFFDENANGVKDAEEAALPLVKLVMENEEDIAFTDANGQYSLLYRSSSSFAPQIANPYVSIVPESHHTTEAEPLDFAVQLEENVTDFCVQMEAAQPHRPGFGVRYYIHAQNLAQAVDDLSLQLDFDAHLQFQGASVQPTGIVGNAIIWEDLSFAALENQTIVVDFIVDASTALGTEVNSDITATFDGQDANPANNTLRLTDIVIGSYDPNDVHVDLERINPQQVANEQVLNYRIRFQNTGTYLAERVVVKNQIDKGLQINEISEIRSSHDMRIEVDGYGKISFIFDNIYLPDSTSNEAESHGYILYQINVKDDLMLGDTIRNQAAIYFDFNEPVITNIATTAVEQFVAVNELPKLVPLQLSPNPVYSGEFVSIQNTEGLGELLVFNTAGQLLSRHQLINDQLDTSDLSSGMYFLLWINDKEKRVAKLVVH